MPVRRTRAVLTFLDRETAGSAAIEFGLFLPLFVILLSGIAELGFASLGSMQVHNAVDAGTLYAAKHGWDSAGISNAVVGSASASSITASPAPSQFCGCPSASGVNTATCGTTCTDGSAVGQYIRISATLTRTTILPSSSFGLPSTLTAQSIIRQN